ncbi:MAG: hypothetical protein JXR31_10770 [Prolixibacteraceae bacterium]|nr:hypothetical protein [Prolixibacteraceae bacterium]MBN2774723.1 hypothetical protein [Prolixibacteraceae bacterium]
MYKIILTILFLIFSFFSYSQIDKEKKVHFIFSLPYVNQFYIQGNDTARNSLGFGGISAGIDFGNSSHAWSIRLMANTDLILPIGPYDIEGEYNSSFAVTIDISRKNISKAYIFNKNFGLDQTLELGYGLHFTRYTWEKINTFSDPSILVKSSNTTSGITGYINYFITRNIYLGIIYQPSFLTFKNNVSFHYQHLISIDAGIKFSLSKAKNNLKEDQ